MEPVLNILILFQLSMVLRSVHSKLVEVYGLPTWGSYLVFALATILVGALLGLVGFKVRYHLNEVLEKTSLHGY